MDADLWSAFWLCAVYWTKGSLLEATEIHLIQTRNRFRLTVASLRDKAILLEKTDNQKIK